MAGLIPIGKIASPGEDVFATTGPHLDVRVIPQFGKDKGKKINPETIRSLLQNIQAAGKPIVQQGKDGQWSWNSPWEECFCWRERIAATICRKGSSNKKPGTPLRTQLWSRVFVVAHGWTTFSGRLPATQRAII